MKEDSIQKRSERWYSRPGLWIGSRPRSRSRSRSCPIEIFITLFPWGFSLTGSKWADMMIIVAAAAPNTTLFSGIRSMHLLWRTWQFKRRRDKSACRLSHANEHCGSALVLSLPPRSPPSPRILSCDSTSTVQHVSGHLVILIVLMIWSSPAEVSVCVYWTVVRGLVWMWCPASLTVCHSMFVYVCMILYTTVLHRMVYLPWHFIS